MKKLLNKTDWIIPFATYVIYFFTVESVIPSAVYIVLACLFSLYYFPFRLLTNINEFENNRFFYILSCFFCSAILTLSALDVIVSLTGFFRTTVGVIGVLCILLSFYALDKLKSKRFFAVLYGISILASGVMWV
ncbi:MAG: hypothetical protein LBL90_10740 [Prevotellaceae bacterium]|jgi:hypothetical protein|nr:hypothetical protein [Prevotellaceae bacterium]